YFARQGAMSSPVADDAETTAAKDAGVRPIPVASRSSGEQAVESPLGDDPYAVPLQQSESTTTEKPPPESPRTLPRRMARSQPVETPQEPQDVTSDAEMAVTAETANTADDELRPVPSADPFGARNRSRASRATRYPDQPATADVADDSSDTAVPTE